MKTQILFLCLCLCTLTYANEQLNLQKVTTSNDAITFVENNHLVTYNVTDIRKMTYEGNMLVVYLTDNTIYSVDVTELVMSSNSDDVTSDLVIKSLNDLDLYIYPNPATDMVFVAGNVAANEKVQLTLYNPSGQLITSSTQPSLSVSNIPRGSYLLHIKINSSLITKPLILQ